jgi:hypothetical protein
MNKADEDIFDQVARLVRDRRLIEQIPYPRNASPKEHHENLENARQRHVEAIASFLRIGGSAADFFGATFHLHGGNSTNLLPLKLALLFRNCESLTAEQCWAFVMCWRKEQGTPYPVGQLTVAPKSSGNLGGKRGRTKGAGSLEGVDAPLIEKMKKLIAEGDAFSPHGAAILVANDAKGAGTVESKATRLANRYKASEEK